MKSTEKFDQWLKARVEAGKRGEPLPSEKELARSFGLSRSTISRALLPLRDKGVIVRIPGKGSYFRAAPPQVSHEPLVSGNAWERLSESLLGLLSRGELRTGGALPPVKYVANQFHVTPATVTRAYRDLVEKGYVEKVGRRYVIGRFEAGLNKGARRHIWFFTWYEPTEDTYFRSTNLGVSYSSMEIELQRYGVALRHFGREDFDAALADAFARRTAPEGFVFYNVWKMAHYEEIVRKLRDFSRLMHRAMPPSLVVTVGMPYIRSSVALLHSGNVITMQARHCAQAIAARGICSSALFLSTQKQVETFLRLHPELISLAPGGAHTVIIGPEKCEDHGPNGPQIILKNGEKLCEYAQSLAARLAEKHPIVDAGRAREHIVFSSDFTQWFAQNKPGRPIAWVFAKTAEAFAALRWARGNNIGVPNPLSIVDLENDSAYYREGISSCVPDWSGIGYLMAHSLLKDIPIERSRKGFIHTRAVFLDRASTP